MWQVFICGVYSGVRKVGQKIWTQMTWVQILCPTLSISLYVPQITTWHMFVYLINY